MNNIEVSELGLRDFDFSRVMTFEQERLSRVSPVCVEVPRIKAVIFVNDRRG
jgi:hypothetical protein